MRKSIHHMIFLALIFVSSLGVASDDHVIDQTSATVFDAEELEDIILDAEAMDPISEALSQLGVSSSTALEQNGPFRHLVIALRLAEVAPDIVVRQAVMDLLYSRPCDRTAIEILIGWCVPCLMLMLSASIDLQSPSAGEVARAIAFSSVVFSSVGFFSYLWNNWRDHYAVGAESSRYDALPPLFFTGLIALSIAAGLPAKFRSQEAAITLCLSSPVWGLFASLLIWKNIIGRTRHNPFVNQLTPKDIPKSRRKIFNQLIRIQIEALKQELDKESFNLFVWPLTLRKDLDALIIEKKVPLRFHFIQTLLENYRNQDLDDEQFFTDIRAILQQMAEGKGENDPATVLLRIYDSTLREASLVDSPTMRSDFF